MTGALLPLPVGAIALDDIRHVADVPVTLEVELDRRTVRVDEALEWEAGAIIWLTRSVGENVDVWVGGELFGSGEIVILENTFGIRLTDFNWPPGDEPRP